MQAYLNLHLEVVTGGRLLGGIYKLREKEEEEESGTVLKQQLVWQNITSKKWLVFIRMRAD